MLKKHNKKKNKNVQKLKLPLWQIKCCNIQIHHKISANFVYNPKKQKTKTKKNELFNSTNFKNGPILEKH